MLKSSPKSTAKYCLSSIAVAHHGSVAVKLGWDVLVLMSRVSRKPVCNPIASLQDEPIEKNVNFLPCEKRLNASIFWALIVMFSQNLIS